MVHKRSNPAAPSVGNVEELADLDSATLLILWKTCFGVPPPPRIRRTLLIDCLAYRIQEQHLGGLRSGVRKQLDSIARGLDSGQKPVVQISSSIKPGTRLIRSWGGQNHEVSVVSDGFIYRGERFGNLSEIARQITGARWSGPLFFGTKVQMGSKV